MSEGTGQHGTGADEQQHTVTLRCPGNCTEFFRELRRRVAEHVVGDMLLQVSPDGSVIHFATGNLPAVRRLVDQLAPDGTSMLVDVPDDEVPPLPPAHGPRHVPD